MSEAEDFLKSWTEGNLPSSTDPALRVGKAKALAHQCRVDAAAAGIDEAELTLAGYGNLVTYFEDRLAGVALSSGDRDSAND
ncbi:MAG: hypothetical protein ACK4SZ_16275 [Allosphingosinicella sp.]|uniref:hypothetical protein n=1 Tax=Allosphingosinicella sp. TaxID=2823234 RepID=UPI00394081A5